MLLNVPVDTGALKMSGRVGHSPNGAWLSFGNQEVDYAAIVHEGTPGGEPIEGSFRVYVPTHVTKKGKVINGHWKEYKNQRVIRFRPKINKFVRGPEIVRVISKEPAQQGQFFVSRAFADELPNFLTLLERNLRQLEKRQF